MTGDTAAMGAFRGVKVVLARCVPSGFVGGINGALIRFGTLERFVVEPVRLWRSGGTGAKFFEFLLFACRFALENKYLILVISIVT